MQVLDTSSVSCDLVIAALTTVTAIGEEFEIQFMQRRMLVPPGFMFATNGSQNASVVLCRTLEDAVKIL